MINVPKKKLTVSPTKSDGLLKLEVRLNSRKTRAHMTVSLSKSYNPKKPLNIKQINQLFLLNTRKLAYLLDC